MAVWERMWRWRWDTNTRKRRFATTLCRGQRGERNSHPLRRDAEAPHLSPNRRCLPAASSTASCPRRSGFERWVFDEVLPSIRQHGAYLTRDKLWEVATSPEALLKLCSDLLAEREKNAALQADNARLQGKAVYYDLFIDLRHSTNLRTTAKELDVPERRFVRFLLERRYVYRTPSGCVLPYAKGSNEGLFCVKDFCRNGHTGSYTLVTPKGKLHFAELRSLILVTV